MNKIILISILTFIYTNSYSQHTSDTSLKNNKLIPFSKDKKGNNHFIGDEKIKSFKKYLLIFPESAVEYKKSRNNATATLVSMGIAIGDLTTIFLSKDKETRKVAALYVNLPALAGITYFGIRTKKHLNKSIENYNKKVSF